MSSPLYWLYQWRRQRKPNGDDGPIPQYDLRAIVLGLIYEPVVSKWEVYLRYVQYLTWAIVLCTALFLLAIVVALVVLCGPLLAAGTLYYIFAGASSNRRGR